MENWRPAGRERARNQKSTKCTITKTLKHEPFEKKSLKLKKQKVNSLPKTSRSKLKH